MASHAFPRPVNLATAFILWKCWEPLGRDTQAMLFWDHHSLLGILPSLYIRLVTLELESACSDEQFIYKPSSKNQTVYGQLYLLCPSNLGKTVILGKC